MVLQKKLIIPLLLLLLLFGCKGKNESEIKDEYTEVEAVDYSSAEESDTAVADTTKKAATISAAIKNYSYSWTDSDEMPPLVIIIDDFGNSGGKLLEDFADLPAEIVFAVLPDLSHTKEAANMAVRKGHEVIIHVPMEAVGSKISPGKKYLKPDMAKDEVERIMDDFISQMPMAIAANNHMGSATTANLTTMTHVIEHLAMQDMYFIDSATTAKSAVYTAANSLDVFSTKRDIFLDVPDVSEANIINKIQSLGKYKGRREPVIIITHCHNRDKLNALQQFITQVKSMGIRIVSLRDAFPGAGV